MTSKLLQSIFTRGTGNNIELLTQKTLWNNNSKVFRHSRLENSSTPDTEYYNIIWIWRISKEMRTIMFLQVM